MNVDSRRLAGLLTEKAEQARKMAQQAALSESKTDDPELCKQYRKAATIWMTRAETLDEVAEGLIVIDDRDHRDRKPEPALQSTRWN